VPHGHCSVQVGGVAALRTPLSRLRHCLNLGRFRSDLLLVALTFAVSTLDHNMLLGPLFSRLRRTLLMRFSRYELVELSQTTTRDMQTNL
jgi:hypothetical protein